MGEGLEEGVEIDPSLHATGQDLHLPKAPQQIPPETPYSGTRILLRVAKHCIQPQKPSSFSIRELVELKHHIRLVVLLIDAEVTLPPKTSPS